MNFRRGRFLELIERIPDHLVLEYSCKIIVVTQGYLSAEEEMIEDLLAIVHIISCRLNKMRKYKKQIREDFAESKEPKETLE